MIARARRQHGLLTVADLVGITGRTDEGRRRLRSGAWQEVLPAVLAPAVVAVDRAQLEAAAMLWVPDGALSHFSAARKNGIWTPGDPGAWVTAPYADPHRSRAGLEIVRTRHPPARWRTDGFFRWTPPARTVVDLAQWLDERALSATLLSAVRNRRTTAEEVALAAAPLRRRAGLALLAKVTALWAPERESLLEDALHSDVRAVARTDIQRQYPVRDRTGLLLGLADVAAPSLRLAFEADGFLFHSTDAQIAADQRRDRRFMAAGWQTARFREGALDDRALVRRDVRDILEQRRRQLGAA